MAEDITMEVEHAGDMHPPVAVAQPLTAPQSGSPSPPPELPSYEPDETLPDEYEGEEPAGEAEEGAEGAEEEESSDSESDESDDESGDEDDAPPPAATATGPLPAAPADAAPAATNGDAMAVDVPTPATPAAAPPLQPVNILVAKPKQKRKARSASGSPPPPPPPPPLQTIRLEFPLGGPDNYEVDIAARAVETGQRAPSPGPPVPIIVPQEENLPEEPAPGKKRRRRRNLDYDLGDPFIDDSDLALDQRTYIAQTKQAGFYVSSGEVALLKDRTAISASASGSKGLGGGGPKSKRPAPHLPSPEPFAGPSNFPGSAHAPIHTQLGKSREQKEKEAREKKEKEDKRRESNAGEGVNGVNGEVGTRDAPIAVVSDEEGTTNGKRKSSSGGDGSSRKRRKVDMDAFHPELKEALAELRAAKEKENWSTKGKFPPGIKPLLTQVALKAIMLNQYDDNFFNYMPEVFPYNRFTMSKLIKRLVFADHMALLIKRQDEILAELKTLADENFDKSREEYDRALRAWQMRMEKQGLPTDGTASADGTPNPQPTAPDAEPANGAASAPPAKRFRLTDKMKGMIWNLVCLSNECCRIENEKSTLEGHAPQVSEQGLRKVLYQKIVAAFPEGWMNSGQISRDVSVIKKKFETAMKEDEV
ncbi:unnamed protein product [Peniophora sp. CBMAI 1063]|nr:unnamed protein product [Peniophora sp. CBMAI 1063]